MSVQEGKTTEVFVLIHMKHVWNKELGHPVDHFRWLSVHETFDEASQRAVEFANENELISEVPLYCWWTMGKDETMQHPWWMSNEFGPAKDVGNTFRVSMRIAKMGDQR